MSAFSLRATASGQCNAVQGQRHLRHPRELASNSQSHTSFRLGRNRNPTTDNIVFSEVANDKVLSIGEFTSPFGFRMIVN